MEVGLEGLKALKGGKATKDDAAKQPPAAGGVQALLSDVDDSRDSDMQMHDMEDDDPRKSGHRFSKTNQPGL